MLSTRKFAVLVVALLLPQAAFAKTDAAEALLAEWMELNATCRGGSGDDPKTMAACDDREAVGDRLKGLGWCYGREGDRGYQKSWVICKAR